MLNWISAAFVATTPASPSQKLVYTSKAEIRYLSWTPAGTLLAVTDHEATEIETGRSRPLPRLSPPEGSPFWSQPYTLLLNARRTHGIGHGFTINLKTLESKPLKRPSLWDGDLRVEVESTAEGRHWLRRGGRRLPIAPGWFVLGLSNDLRYALATRKEPFDGDTTHLLRIDPKTGRGSSIRSYPNTSDDHTWLCIVQGQGSGGPVLVHTLHLAGDLAKPFLAGAKLRSVPLPAPAGSTSVSSIVEWIAPTTPWAIVRQNAMTEKGDAGSDIDTFHLWNAKTGKTVRLAMTTDPWDGREDVRGDGAALGAYTIDWGRRRFAYTVVYPSGSQVYVRRL